MISAQEAQEYLASIPASSCTYQEWVDVGMALHHEGLPVSVWDDWSRNDSRYHAGECERKWRTFGNGSDQVTMGTVIHMARANGWEPRNPWGVSFNVPITADEPGTYEPEPEPLTEPDDTWNPAEQAITFLRAIFEPDDHVAFVLDARKGDDGKWKPAAKGLCSYTRDELIGIIEKHNSLAFLGPSEPEAGAWICLNPVDGTGRRNENVTKFRYALIESDTQSIEEQLRIYKAMRLPIKTLVHSGGKSLHAAVHIDAADASEYAERVKILHEKCSERGLVVDTQNKNPSRLSRFPGYVRGEKKQYIVACDIGCRDWAEWISEGNGETVKPLQVLNLKDALANKPPLKPELIKGILRQGHKMLVVSSSKAGKSFALIELAICISEGIQWLGFPCQQGSVLYLNMEIDEASFIDRIANVYKAMEITTPKSDMIDIVTLRGQADDMNHVIQRTIATARGKTYSAIIVDPIYKLGIGDENAAKEVATFCNAMDALAANTEASVIYAHHHSKGQQGSKSSMDRASGSGVFARDPDAILDMIELSIPESRREEIESRYGEDVTAWRLDATLREFRRINPVNLFFAWPLHEIDEDGLLDDVPLAESERALKDGREKGTAKNQGKGEENYQQYASMRRFNDETGTKITQKEYAESIGVKERQVRRYKDRYDRENRT